MVCLEIVTKMHVIKKHHKKNGDELIEIIVKIDEHQLYTYKKTNCNTLQN